MTNYPKNSFSSPFIFTIFINIIIMYNNACAWGGIMENLNLQWDNRFKIIFTSTKIEVLKFAWSFPIHSIRHILKLIIHLFMTREHNCNLVLSSPYNLKFKLISKINHSIMLMHYYYYYKYMNIIIIVLILNSENYDGNNWMYFFWRWDG